MPTVITHPVVPVALAISLGRSLVSGRLLAVGVVASILPDLDMLAFRYGIPYAHDFGHRGASHSLALALLLGVLAAAGFKWLKARPWMAFAFVFISAASHPLLDMITHGGLGVALFWPFSSERLHFPVQVLEAAPFRLEQLMGAPGQRVLLLELYWVWLPAFSAAFFLALSRWAVCAVRSLRRKNRHGPVP